MNTIKIGLIGLGTVGGSVLQMLTENQDKVQNITGQRLSVKTIVVRDTEKHQAAVPEGVTLTSDLDAIINDPEIKIVVEVMGGVHPAKEIITQLLNAKNTWSPPTRTSSPLLVKNSPTSPVRTL